MKYFILLLSVGIGFSCKKDCRQNYPDAVPSCIITKIEELKSNPKGNPAYSVYQYDYNGQKVYYFPAQCCDQFSVLYDKNCNFLCNPNGGIGGGGNGGCTDFFSTRTNEVLIWKDNR